MITFWRASSRSLGHRTPILWEQLLFSCQIMSNSLWSHGLQHTRLLCPSPASGVCSDSCLLSQWCLYNSLILCHPLLLLPSIVPSIRVFSSKSALCIRWSKYWSFSFSVSPSNEYSGLISFRLTSLISFLSKGLSVVFFSTAFQKHQIFGGNRVGPWEKKTRNSVSESMVQDTCIGGTIAFYVPNPVKYSYTVSSENVFANSHCWEWEVSLKGYCRKPKTSGVSRDDFFFPLLFHCWSFGQFLHLSDKDVRAETLFWGKIFSSFLSSVRKFIMKSQPKGSFQLTLSKSFLCKSNLLATQSICHHSALSGTV